MPTQDLNNIGKIADVSTKTYHSVFTERDLSNTAKLPVFNWSFFGSSPVVMNVG